MNNKIKKLREQLDKVKYKCKQGCFECCTAVPVLPDELREMKAYLRKQGITEPPNGKGDEYCQFLTTEGKCSVYAQRPMICRSFSGTKYIMKSGTQSIPTQSCTYGDGKEENATIEFIRYGSELMQKGVIIGSKGMLTEMENINNITNIGE